MELFSLRLSIVCLIAQQPDPVADLISLVLNMLWILQPKSLFPWQLIKASRVSDLQKELVSGTPPPPVQKERGSMKLRMFTDAQGYFLRGVDALAPSLARALHILVAIPTGSAAPYDEISDLISELGRTQVRVLM